MQYQPIGYRIKGFYRIGGYAINTPMNHTIAAQRLSVLKFWDKHGLTAALDHSGKSRRTLYAWRKAYRRSAVKRRPKGYRPSQIGECVGMDAIERRMGGVKRTILTYIDEASHYALAVPWLNSRMAKVFFEKCFRLTPFPIQQVITGSGSEFKGEFDPLLQESQIAHLWTYPKTLKMNAVCERFNRTLQEQFVDFHEHRLFDDLERFNEKLADWLVQYNSLRPHKGLALRTPVQYIIQHNQQCNRWWTHTV